MDGEKYIQQRGKGEENTGNVVLLLSLGFLLLLRGGMGVGGFGIFAVGSAEGGFAFFSGSGHFDYVKGASG